MRKCSFCGSEQDDGSFFCGCCGHRLATPQSWECIHCGRTWQTDTPFCALCGAARQPVNPPEAACDGEPSPAAEPQEGAPPSDGGDAPAPPVIQFPPDAPPPVRQEHKPAAATSSEGDHRIRTLTVNRQAQQLYLFANYNVFVNGCRVAQLVSPGERITLSVQGNPIEFGIQDAHVFGRVHKLSVWLELGENPVVNMHLIYPGDIQITVEDAAILRTI